MGYSIQKVTLTENMYQKSDVETYLVDAKAALAQGKTTQYCV